MRHICTTNANTVFLQETRHPMLVHLPIQKPILRAYLAYLFQAEGEAFKVSSTSAFGSVLIDFVKYSDKRVSHHPDDMAFILPKLDRIANARNHHLYYGPEQIAKLNSLLETFFNIDFDQYYLAGKKTDAQQKEIIMSFIISRKLAGLVSDVETLKKRQYRAERNLLSTYFTKLKNKAYQRHESIQYICETVNVNIDKIIYS